MTQSGKRLLFLYTGGTLGMTSKGNPGPLSPATWSDDMLSYLPGLRDYAQVDGQVLCNRDSTDMTPAEWELMAGAVAASMDDYDGFVIVHGTDTMAYTASALSYLLSNLHKPVILTGSQRPIAKLRTDARRNMIHAAICATLPVPEVGVYFDERLMRGNRTTKVDVRSYIAFDSPSLPPLVRMGVDRTTPTPARLPKGDFVLHKGFCRDVAVLWLFPGASARAIDDAVARGTRGIVICAFGAGNVPLSEWPDAIRRATDAGVPVVLTSQCLRGGVVLGMYDGSKAAQDAGALSGWDLTHEAALTRMMFLLADERGPGDFGERWARDIAGEIA